MAEPAVAHDSVKANWTNKTIEVTGQLIWNVLTVVGIALMLYGGWQHAEASKEANKSVVKAIEEANQTNVILVRAMQEANCLSRLTPEQKKSAAEIEWCKKIGQGKAF